MKLAHLRVAAQRLPCAALLCLLAAPQLSSAHSEAPDGVVGHAHSDGYYAALAQDFEPFAAAMGAPPEPGDLITTGSWGPVLSWPHIPVSAASLPDGRVLTFASNQPTTFPTGPEFTYAAVWDPVTENIQTVNHDQHDMFCGHLVMLEDGSVFVNGGRNTVSLTSIFDFQTDQWSLGDQMGRGRWYPTTVYLPDGGVFTSIGSGGGDSAEVWRPGVGWQDLSINLTSIQAGTGFEKDWWPYYHVDPRGKLTHTGPVTDMHRIDPYGSGAIENLGPWLPSNIWYSKHAAVTMYDVGKVIIAGGDDDGNDTSGSTNRVLTVDLNGTLPLPVEVSAMQHNRRFANAVMLPDGRVLVVGGNTSGEKFNDSGTVLTPEIWDPATDTWTAVADMMVPRNYHSVALLLTDGRVFSGGGGLCGCAADHSDAQIYSPPYLFAADGAAALRPNVVTSPASVRNGEVFAVTASPGVDRFTLIKMSATTHAVNTDLRFIDVPFTDEGGGIYHLTAHPSRDVALPGYWLLFALSGGVPSLGQVLQFSTANVPSIEHPGPIQDVAGDPLSHQFVGSDPNGDPLTWSASGLPPGLSLDPNSGLVTGTPPTGSEGSYEAVIDLQDAGGGPTIHVTWRILPDGLGSGSILREWWFGIAGNAISALTGDADYPANPDGSDHPTQFEAPTNWADNYGTRMRGYVHAPVGGDYRFYLSSDDNGELWLSTDADPANAVIIANVPGWSSSREWTKFPGQQDSALISLQAGQPYYIEALQKEGGGGDNLAVAWETPGSSLAVIDGIYLSPFDSGPFVSAIPGQASGEGDSISIQVVATHPAGVPLTYSATGLPLGVGIDTATGLISGTLSPGSAGSHGPVVTVQDGSGGSDATSFGWVVTQGGVLPVGSLWSGVACQDGATGTGYLLYSAESVHTRWSANPPVDDGPSARNSDHFICTKYAGGVWTYDTNNDYYPFTPRASDVLVAATDYGLDTVTSLEGQNSSLGGIPMGYLSGDLQYLADTWEGGGNNGEFSVTGTGFLPNELGAGGVCGNGVVETGEACDGGDCCTACSFDAGGSACNDGDACTDSDQCDGAGSCTAGAALVCDDGLFCNGNESCDSASGCLAGTPPGVDDGVSCTADSCDEASDVVLHAPQDAMCDDGLFCNGAEICDIAAECGPGMPPLLDDGVACTADSCDEVADAVVHTPVAALCEDADICTTFVCDPLSGCLDAGPPPEHEATCVAPPAVPSLPPWGLLLTTAIMVAGGSAGLWRRRVRSNPEL